MLPMIKSLFDIDRQSRNKQVNKWTDHLKKKNIKFSKGLRYYLVVHFASKNDLCHKIFIYRAPKEYKFWTQSCYWLNTIVVKS